MFEYLNAVDRSVVNRCNTVVRNIKAASNSFYDSYLDLLEEFIKEIAEDNGFDMTGKTCGAIIRQTEIKDFLINKVGIDKKVYEKLGDYILKINKHKHHLEKNVSIDIVKNYMVVFDNFAIQYIACMKTGIETKHVDMDELEHLFGQTERENEKLKNEAEKLKNELKEVIETEKLSSEAIDSYKKIIADKEIDTLELEEQNEELHKQISVLKDIKLSSMEEKLNKVIKLLTDLEDYLVESRAVSMAAGYAITGKGQFPKYVDAAREIMNKEKNK